MQRATLPPLRSVQLLALLAHDLRSPLAAILTNLGFVESAVSESDADAIDALADSRLSCATLEHLIANLDVIAGVGTMQPPRPAPLWHLVSAAVGRIGPHASAAGVTIQVRQEPCPEVLVGTVSFGRALDNVLANAVQYSEAGGSVSVEARVSQDAQRGEVIVVDDGPVVPEDLRSVVLTADGQMMAKQRSEGRYGRGLGLYCAAQAAVTGGARLTVGARDGRSLFSLSAPLANEQR